MPTTPLVDRAAFEARVELRGLLPDLAEMKKVSPRWGRSAEVERGEVGAMGKSGGQICSLRSTFYL